MRADPGFRADHLLTFRLPVVRGRPDTPATCRPVDPMIALRQQ
jgi:hypothetical protein